MTILVTGAQGFIGRNLIAELKNKGYTEILTYDINDSEETLEQYTQKCDFIFHLAGVNRPNDEKEFVTGNVDFTIKLIELLKQSSNKSPILITSSIQAELNNPYGISKKASEEILNEYSNTTGIPTFIYRLPNVFGKWCRPNYNSAVATFCHNIAHGLPITVNNTDTIMNLVYIDDVVNAFIDKLKSVQPHLVETYMSIPNYTVRLGNIVNLINSFKTNRENLNIPYMKDDFTRKLYATYLSYLPPNKFNYPLKMNKDNRGSFTEFIRTEDKGQFSVNISNPGIKKGEHWHHTKNEKFLVVSGTGIIRFRQINSEEIYEYEVSGDNLEVVDIPPGYTHNIINTGSEKMITMMWASEPFDINNPDTYYLEV